MEENKQKKRQTATTPPAAKEVRTEHKRLTSAGKTEQADKLQLQKTRLKSYKAYERNKGQEAKWTQCPLKKQAFP